MWLSLQGEIRVEGGDWIERGAKGTAWRDGSILYLDLFGDYTALCNC